MMPKAGGQYVYLRESLGPLWGFLYGWTLFLVIQTGTIAAVCVAFGKFLGVFFPAVSTSNWLWHIAHVPAVTIGPMVLGNMDIGVNTANLVGIIDRRPARSRECLRRQTRRDDPEHLHFGQSLVARGTGDAAFTVGRNAIAWNANFGVGFSEFLAKRRLAARLIQCRSASAARWFW